MVNVYDKFIPATQKIERDRSNLVYDKFLPAGYEERDEPAFDVGDIPFATLSEARTGTSELVAMNPLRGKQQIDYFRPVYDTIALATAAAVPAAVGRVTILRYDSSSAYCPVEYVWRLTQPTHALYFAAGDSGYFAPTVSTLNAWAAGMSPSATGSVNSASLVRARNFITSLTGGGTVHIPNGAYTMGASAEDSNYMFRLIDASNVTIRGEDKHHTKLTASSATFGGFSLARLENCTIENLWIDCSAPTSPGGSVGAHGIRGEGLTHCDLKHLRLTNLVGYGIGLQGDEGDGGFINCQLFDIYIKNTSQDGIDVKNRDGVNKNNSMQKIWVEDTGRNGADVCLDIRGDGWTISDCHLKPNCASFAIQLRGDSDGGAQTGGRHCVLDNIFIDANVAAVGSGASGIYVDNIDNAISNISIQNLETSTTGPKGIWVTASGLRTVVSNVHTIHGGTTGNAGYHFLVEGTKCSFTNCHARGSGIGFRDTGGLNIYMNCMTHSVHFAVQSTVGSHYVAVTCHDTQTTVYSAGGGDVKSVCSF